MRFQKIEKQKNLKKASYCILHRCYDIERTKDFSNELATSISLKSLEHEEPLWGLNLEFEFNNESQIKG